MNAEQAKQVWRDGLFDEFDYYVKTVCHAVTNTVSQHHIDLLIDFNEYKAGNHHLEPLAKPLPPEPYEAPEAGEAKYEPEVMDGPDD
jgi:hypothetical protein